MFSRRPYFPPAFLTYDQSPIMSGQLMRKVIIININKFFVFSRRKFVPLRTIGFLETVKSRDVTYFLIFFSRRTKWSPSLVESLQQFPEMSGALRNELFYHDNISFFLPLIEAVKIFQHHNLPRKNSMWYSRGGV